jgi:hypothetical protein
VTESRDIIFAWEEIRSQANEVFSDEETPPHKEQNGVTKDIGLTINGTSDDESEMYPVTKKRRYLREDICVGVAKESLLPGNRNGVTLIQAEAVVMSDEVLKKSRREGRLESLRILTQ